MSLTTSASKKNYPHSKDSNFLRILEWKLINVVSLVYGHPENLIKWRHKDRSGNEIVLTFYINGNSDKRKSSLLRVMNDKTLLIKRLNDELKKVDEFAAMSVVKLSQSIISRKPGNVILHNQTIKCN